MVNVMMRRISYLFISDELVWEELDTRPRVILGSEEMVRMRANELR